MLATRIGRLVQRTDLGIARAIESLLIRSASPKATRIPLVAVCGAPRTGSTLIYQLISQGFDCFYISNLQNVLFRTPLLGLLARRRLTGPYVSEYRSTGGFVPGLSGPAEAMHFWAYWLDQQLDERPPRPSERKLRRFRQVMNAIYARERKPLLAGYLPHALYTTQLMETFPQVLFVRCDRDLLDAAISALHRWAATEVESAAFFGVRPVEAAEAGISRSEYVARQQYFIARRMDEQERQHPRQFLHARYEEICADPRGFLDELGERLRELGIEAARRRDTTIPQSFAAKTYADATGETEREIAAALDRLHDEHGPTLSVYRRWAGRAHQPAAGNRADR